MESSTNTFRYSTLDSSKGEIRLISLQPSNEHSAAIRCEIFHASLEEEPAFEALSYAWGDTTASSQIFVNDDEFYVTLSLETALRYIREQHTARTLWIDAICINQRDIRERSEQVSLMGRIYSSAMCDLLWLGEDTGLDDDVASVLEREYGENEQESVAFLMNDLFTLADFQTRVIGEIRTLFDVPMVWSRIWIVQEVVLAWDVQVLYGKRKFPWQTLRYVCIGVARQQLSCLWPDGSALIFSKGLSCASNLLSFRQSKSTSFTLPLSEIWNRFGRFGATDPRDRVFGILGFLQDDLGVQMDYAKCPEEIYIEVVWRYVLTTGDLNVLLLDLLYVETPGQPSGILPSWVPKFGTEPLSTKFHIWKRFSAGGSIFRGSGIEKHPKCNNILSVEGVLLDNVGSLIISKPLSSWLLEDFVANFQKAQVLAGYDYSKGDESFDTYWRTLTLDLSLRYQFRDFMKVDPDAHRRILKDVLLEPDSKEEDGRRAAQEVLHYTGNFTGDNFFTITQGGFSAMVPPSAKEGDIILVLLGASAPLVARAISGLGDADALPQRYRLIGPAYVHGFMDGEAIGMLDKGLSKQMFELV
jgi:hypothetical protein